jgi:integrase/recombinase XerD
MTHTADNDAPSDPRTTEHYDRARGNLDRHGVHFLTAYVAGV